MPPQDRVEALIRRFADDLQSILREQLSDEVTTAVQAALGGGGGGRGGRRGSGSNGGGGGGGGRAGKRTPEQIEKQADKLLAFIKANPDQRAEQIAKANKMTTTELVLPIKRLLEDKKIKAAGKARGTTYAIVK